MEKNTSSVNTLYILQQQAKLIRCLQREKEELQKQVAYTEHLLLLLYKETDPACVSAICAKLTQMQWESGNIEEQLLASRCLKAIGYVGDSSIGARN